MAIVSLRRSAVCGLLLWLVLIPAVAVAHRLPPEVVAFFEVEGARLRVLVRVPTAVLGDAGLPRVNTSLLDVARIDTRLDAIAAEVARSLDIADGDRPLVPGPARSRLSVLLDRSFCQYDTALAHMSDPPVPVDRPVYWNEAFVDVQLDYVLATPAPRLSARLNGLRTGADVFQTRGTFIPEHGPSRTVVVTGSPRRVSFEPALAQAARDVLGRLVELLPAERLVWLMVLCLAIPAWRGRGAARPVAAFVLLLSVSVALTSASTVPLEDAVVDIGQLLGAGMVMLAAIHAIIEGQRAGATALAAGAGAALGVGVGHRLHGLMPQAGSHTVALIVASLVVLATTVGVVAALLSAVVRSTQGWAEPAWLLTGLWSAWPIHESAHVAMDAAVRLGARDSWLMAPAAAWLVRHGPLIAVGVFALVMGVLGRGRRLSPPQVPEGGAA